MLVFFLGIIVGFAIAVIVGVILSYRDQHPEIQVERCPKCNKEFILNDRIGEFLQIPSCECRETWESMGLFRSTDQEENE